MTEKTDKEELEKKNKMMNKKSTTYKHNKDKNRDKPEAQSTSTKLTKRWRCYR